MNLNLKEVRILLIFILILSLYSFIKISNNLYYKKNTFIFQNVLKEKNKKAIEDLKININIASIKDIMFLKGIGETKAEAIISYRKINGNFKTITDIQKVKGIGPKIFEKIKDQIKV